MLGMLASTATSQDLQVQEILENSSLGLVLSIPCALAHKQKTPQHVFSWPVVCNMRGYAQLMTFYGAHAEMGVV